MFFMTLDYYFPLLDMNRIGCLEKAKGSPIEPQNRAKMTKIEKIGKCRVNQNLLFFQMNERGKERKAGINCQSMAGVLLLELFWSNFEQGRIHGIRCVLAHTDNSFGQKRHFCMVSTHVRPTDGRMDRRTGGPTDQQKFLIVVVK